MGSEAPPAKEASLEMGANVAVLQEVSRTDHRRSDFANKADYVAAVKVDVGGHKPIR